MARSTTSIRQKRSKRPNYYTILGCIRIMEKKMETAKCCLGNIDIKEKKMETTHDSMKSSALRIL